LGGFLEGVLPDADDFPSLTAELAVDPSVTSDVVLPFFIPKLPVGLWAGVALGAAVPETSIDKYGNFGFWKNEVRCSRQQKMPSPSSDPV